MKTDYKKVVEAMEAYLKQEEADHHKGEMMSMAEMVQGEISARAHKLRLEALIKENTK